VPDLNRSRAPAARGVQRFSSFPLTHSPNPPTNLEADMRTATKNNLGILLNLLRDHRGATVTDRRKLLKVIRDERMQEEFLLRVRDRFGVDVDSLRALLELLVEYAPQLFKIVADVIAMFS
jgi:hypothetical protein